MPLITINDAGTHFHCNDDDPILRGALRAGVALPYECGVGACGCCRCELIKGEVDNLWPEAPGLSDRDRRKGRILACQSLARGQVKLKLHLDEDNPAPIPPRRQQVRLVESLDITHDIREFVFKGEEPARFLPGQYAFLALPGLDRERAYSLANLANDQGEWRFRIRRVSQGAGTALLFNRLSPGTQVGLDAPYGQAYLRQPLVRDIVCIAGGSGLAPMLSVARGAADQLRARQSRLDFFYGGRTPADICGESDLACLPGYGEQLYYHPVVSEPGDRADWQGATGYVHEQLQPTLGNRFTQCDFYLAGPPPMIAATLELLQGRHAISPGRIHFDRFF